MGKWSPFLCNKIIKNCAWRNGHYNEIVRDTCQSSFLLKINKTSELVHLLDQFVVEQGYPVQCQATI